MALNNYEEIVTNFASPTLVLAGPGAGKTYLLADRIKRLLYDGTDKSIITVLTFGKDANQHMINELIKPRTGIVGSGFTTSQNIKRKRRKGEIRNSESNFCIK